MLVLAILHVLNTKIENKNPWGKNSYFHGNLGEPYFYEN
jgi:hypothetical protein